VEAANGRAGRRHLRLARADGDAGSREHGGRFRLRDLAEGARPAPPRPGAGDLGPWRLLIAQTVLIRGTSSKAKLRHPLAAFGLVFLTLGIYYLVWYFKINRELRDLGRATGEEERLGRRPGVSLLAISVGWLVLVPPFVSFYRTMQRIEAAQELSGTSDRVNAWLGFALYVAGLMTLPVEIIYAQSELNRLWRGERLRGPASAAAVAPI
jgi:hypothetical protein